MSRRLSDIQAIDRNIEELETVVSLGDKLKELHNSPEFQEIFVQNYLVKDAARYAQLSADPVLSKDQQADALLMAQATGHFKRYMQVILAQASRAASNIESERENRHQLQMMSDDEYDGLPEADEDQE